MSFQREWMILWEIILGSQREWMSDLSNLIGDIIDKDKRMCWSVVRLGDASKPDGSEFLVMTENSWRWCIHSDTSPSLHCPTIITIITNDHHHHLSCPAVSLIWSLIFSPSISTVLIMKSTPIVAPCPGGNIPCNGQCEMWNTNTKYKSKIQIQIQNTNTKTGKPAWTCARDRFFPHQHSQRAQPAIKCPQ